MTCNTTYKLESFHVWLEIWLTLPWMKDLLEWKLEWKNPALPVYTCKGVWSWTVMLYFAIINRIWIELTNWEFTDKLDSVRYVFRIDNSPWIMLRDKQSWLITFFFFRHKHLMATFIQNSMAQNAGDVITSSGSLWSQIEVKASLCTATMKRKFSVCSCRQTAYSTQTSGLLVRKTGNGWWQLLVNNLISGSSAFPPFFSPN